MIVVGMRITPSASDIDMMGHVNHSVYLRWIEDAVLAHWRSSATPEEIAAFQWIALRHEIDYRAPAFEGDELVVSTRPTEVRRARAWYDTLIQRDGLSLVEARSCWGCLDATTGRLTALPRETGSRILVTI
jgi:acyl-CoA thioester hydrolase